MMKIIDNQVEEVMVEDDNIAVSAQEWWNGEGFTIVVSGENDAFQHISLTNKQIGMMEMALAKLRAV